MAVSTPRGLGPLPPYPADVDTLGTWADTEKIKELARQRQRRARFSTVEDLTGGNFTITNGGGVSGSLDVYRSSTRRRARFWECML